MISHATLNSRARLVTAAMVMPVIPKASNLYEGGLALGWLIGSEIIGGDALAKLIVEGSVMYVIVDDEDDMVVGETDTSMVDFEPELDEIGTSLAAGVPPESCILAHSQ